MEGEQPAAWHRAAGLPPSAHMCAMRIMTTRLSIWDAACTHAERRAVGGRGGRVGGTCHPMRLGKPWEGPILLTAEGTGVCKPSVAYANNESNAFTVKMGSLFSLSAPLVATPRPGRGTHQITHTCTRTRTLLVYRTPRMRNPSPFDAGRPRFVPPASGLTSAEAAAEGWIGVLWALSPPPATCGRGLSEFMQHAQSTADWTVLWGVCPLISSFKACLT